jgi:hypothetical protein
MKRRLMSYLSSFIFALAGVLISGLWAHRLAAAEDFQVPPLPSVEGPITGPGEMVIDGLGLEVAWGPMVEAGLDRGSYGAVEDAGYVREEFFISGSSGGNPYKVRALITHPADPKRFTGHVLVEHNHAVETSFVWQFTRDFQLSRGHAHMGLSTSTANVGFLKSFNSARYATLQVAAGQISDIVAQVGRLLKSKQSPLGGVTYITFSGYSMAAAPVVDYMTTHHQVFRLPDGGPIYDGFFLPPSRTACRRGPLPDVDVPVLWVNSQLEVEEVISGDAIDCRKPDSDEPGSQFRLYEVAGMAHYDSHYLPGYWNQPCANPRDTYPHSRIISTMFYHYIRWIRDGVPPAPGRLIPLIGGVGGEIELDEHGNAVGGIRHTYVDVPIATYSPLNAYALPPAPADYNCTVYGSTLDFSPGELATLYKNHGDYVNQVNRRLNELVRDGWLLSEYAKEFRVEAAHFAGIRANE